VKQRPTAVGVVLASGVLAAAVFAASGVVPHITHWEDRSRVTRQVLGDVPAAVQVTFYTVIVAMALILGWLWANRLRNWSRGSAEDRSTTRANLRRRMRDYRAGSGLGAAGFIVYDDTACMVDVATVLSRSLYVESCGQCPPCKLGTGAITSALDDIAAGRGTDASLEAMNHWLSVVADANRCFLPVEEQQMIGAMLRMFPDDFEAHLEGECTRPHRAAIPKLLDIVDDHAVFDDRQTRKRPDWTYEP
jgi:hypothetical protein